MTGSENKSPHWIGRDGLPVSTGAPFGLMGIINITPDSFYDGGKYSRPRRAILHAEELAADGAHILDLGAESSRPGAESLAPAKEWERLAPVIGKIIALGKPVSVDTWHAATAARALECGASIINDISGCLWEPELLDVLVQHKPAYVLTHSGGRPETMQISPSYGNVVEEVKAFFGDRLEALTKAGLPENRIVLDPGIGFGKTLRHNLELLANVEAFAHFGRPLLAGLSMKSMFGALLGLPSARRAPATATACALLLEKGVFWHRVHDVAGAARALKLAACIQNPDYAEMPA